MHRGEESCQRKLNLGYQRIPGYTGKAWVRLRVTLLEFSDLHGYQEHQASHDTIDRNSYELLLEPDEKTVFLV